MDITQCLSWTFDENCSDFWGGHDNAISNFTRGTRDSTGANTTPLQFMKYLGSKPTWKVTGFSENAETSGNGQREDRNGFRNEIAWNGSHIQTEDILTRILRIMNRGIQCSHEKLWEIWDWNYSMEYAQWSSYGQTHAVLQCANNIWNSKKSAVLLSLSNKISTLRFWVRNCSI